MAREAVLLFRAAGTAFALARQHVQRVVAVPRLTRPPLAPACLAGFLDDGGAPVCVLRFRSLIGAAFSDPPGLYEHVILLRDTGRRWALLVDRVTSLLVPESDAVQALPEGVSLRNAFAAQIGAAGGRAALVDPARLVADFERDCIDHFLAEEQRLREAFAEGAP